MSSRCSTASARTSSSRPRARASGCASTCPSAPTGTATSCAGWPSVRPTWPSSCAPSPGAETPPPIPQPHPNPPKGKHTVDAVTRVPQPVNEPVLGYGPNTPERARLTEALAELQSQPIELTMTIGGKQRMGGGERLDVVQPHRRAHVLGTLAEATRQDARDAIDAAAAAARDWRELSFDDRAAVFLKAADLLTGPWRARVNAATMLGQSKTAQQAEIDAACELAD